MEQIYALGVSCIQVIQDWFRDYDSYWEFMNNVSNPHNITEFLFPLLSIVDSVFAAQLLLCMAFGGWINTVLKWWFFEDRPYWWVRESTYYPAGLRPRLYQTRQTCETGPGSPSGHSSAAALTLTLTVMFFAHVAYDRKWSVKPWLKSLAVPIFIWGLGSVMIARMYVAAHFPHQCVLGALVGLFLAPALCLYVSDPFIWQYGFHSAYPSSKAVMWHCLSALMTAAIAGITYVAVAIKQDPMTTVQLAFRWCENPDSIHVTTTPIFALVQSTASLLGWAITVTPAIAKYRHNTKNRSIIISAFSTILILYIYKEIDDNLCRSNTLRFYLSKFVLFFVKPMLLLRVVPAISMWPFTGKDYMNHLDTSHLHRFLATEAPEESPTNWACLFFW